MLTPTQLPGLDWTELNLGTISVTKRLFFFLYSNLITKVAVTAKVTQVELKSRKIDATLKLTHTNLDHSKDFYDKSDDETQTRRGETTS